MKYSHVVILISVARRSVTHMKSKVETVELELLYVEPLSMVNCADQTKALG